mmetsp:Transcript_142587/g.443477  ORF Transcript_142587/g.443477 Transcript_142587/m.443477 type:complete len:257 (-) Transcript_142587:5-775(-)
MHASLLAPREAVDQPRLYGPKATSPLDHCRLHRLVVVHHPLHLHGREVRRDRETRSLSEVVLPAGVGEVLCSLRSPQVKPDHRVAERLARLLVPGHGGLPLVGDADAGHIALRGACLGEDVRAALQHAREDLGGIVLTPAWTGVVLLELYLVHGRDVAFAVKENGAAGGRAIVNGHDVLRLMARRDREQAPGSRQHHCRVRGAGACCCMLPMPGCTRGGRQRHSGGHRQAGGAHNAPARRGEHGVQGTGPRPGALA